MCISSIFKKSFFHVFPLGICRTVDGATREDFALLATLGDASKAILALSWGGPLLAAGGGDKKIRVYDGTEVTGPRCRCDFGA
jgi:hypothetical protein